MKIPDPPKKPIGIRSVAAAVQYQRPLKNRKEEPQRQMQSESSKSKEAADGTDVVAE